VDGRGQAGGAGDRVGERGRPGRGAAAGAGRLDPDEAERHAADVAETIFWLIASNPYVTGETIVVDGGYAATT
jgi:NAD(P)-dependent dehydrogenase (short-subunit alcohol dehydrogenase family)